MQAYFAVNEAKTKRLVVNKCPSWFFAKYDSVLFPLGYMSLVFLVMLSTLEDFGNEFTEVINEIYK